MKSTGEIIFIIPPSRWVDQRYSLGIMYVSSYLREHGYNNLIIDDNIMRGGFYTQEDAVRSIIKVIENEKPKFVGITCLINEINETIDLNNKIKKVSPKTKTLVGGTQAFDTPEIFLRNGIDYVVRGEGEITTLELIDHLYKGEEIDKVKGIVWIRDNNIVYNEACPLIDKLDDIPYPSYDLVNMERHVAIHNWVIRGLPLKTAMVMTSRGCPYSCSFCECNAIFGRKVRYKSYENIYGEIKLLRDKYNAEAIWFVDDTITINKEHIKKICKIMKDLEMWWGCQGRINTVDSEMIMEMKESGCIQIDFGVESGSNRILKEIINKHITVEQTIRAFEICHKYQMRTLANLMIGLPTESRDEMLKTLQLGKEINANSYVLSIATPLPNTRLWDMINPNIDDDELYKMNFFNSELLDKFNKSEVKDLVALREEFLHELNNQHKIKERLSTIKWYFKIIIRTKYKKEYLSYFLSFFTFKNLAKAIITLLDNRFKTNLYGKAVKFKEAYYSSNFLNAIRRNIDPVMVKWKYKLRIKDKTPLKLHLGCGGRHFEDYINIDLRKTRATDLVCDIRKLPYPDNSVELIETYHVIEHLPRHDSPKALKAWYGLLTHEGKLIIECPDFDDAVKEYIEGNEESIDNIFGLQRFPGDAHLFGYNFKRLEKLLEAVGFKDIQKREPQDPHIKDEPCVRVECVKGDKP